MLADSESEPESARSYSRGCTSSPAISTRVSTSRPDAITRLSSSEPVSDTSLAVAPAQQNKSTIVRRRSFICQRRARKMRQYEFPGCLRWLQKM